MNQEFYCYILKGKLDFYYCGITKDIDKRYLQHNRGESKSTRQFSPYAIKFLRRFDTMKEARVLEVKIKIAGVKKWYEKNIKFGRYPNMVISKLISKNWPV